MAVASLPHGRGLLGTNFPGCSNTFRAAPWQLSHLGMPGKFTIFLKKSVGIFSWGLQGWSGELGVHTHSAQTAFFVMVHCVGVQGTVWFARVEPYFRQDYDYEWINGGFATCFLLLEWSKYCCSRMITYRNDNCWCDKCIRSDLKVRLYMYQIKKKADAPFVLELDISIWIDLPFCVLPKH